MFKSGAALYAAYADETGKTDKNYNGAKKVVDDLTGGIGKQNGQNYFLPKGKTEDDVEDYIDELDRTSLPELFGMTQANGISIIKKGQLISSGQNKYRVRYQGKYLKTIDNKFYEMEIK
jgi:hypothetical protein